jgi:hypothetical protein
MNATTALALGTKVQRKGSSVIWTIDAHDNMALPEGKTFGYATVDLGIEGATEVRVTCIAKRNGKMSKWINVESFKKNWLEA